MRFFAFVALFGLTTAAAAAEYHYIIPVVGSSTGFDGSHYAMTTLFNPTSRTAVVRRLGVYPLFPMSASCEPPATLDVAPRQERGIDTICSGPVFATEIVSSEPLRVESSILHLRITGSCLLADTQQFEAPQEWFDPGVDVRVKARASANVDIRSNLVVVNPNDEPLVLQIHLVRLDVESDNTRDDTLVVAPRSLLIHPLREIDDGTGGIHDPIVLTGDHILTVRGSGRFWIGVSQIDHEGGNTFSKGIQLEP